MRRSVAAASGSRAFAQELEVDGAGASGYAMHGGTGGMEAAAQRLYSSATISSARRVARRRITPRCELRMNSTR